MALRLRPCSKWGMHSTVVENERQLCVKPQSCREAARHSGVCAAQSPKHKASIPPRPRIQRPLSTHLDVAEVLQDAAPGATAILCEVGAGSGIVIRGRKAASEQLVDGAAAPIVPRRRDEGLGWGVVRGGRRGKEQR